MPIRPPARLLSPLLLERDRLVGAIGGTIRQTFAAAQVGCVGTAGEVDKLVYFFLEGLPLIETQFNHILRAHGVRATLSGIFCHQTPKVTPTPAFAGRGSICELGDILFLVTYGKRLRGEFLGNAMLVQAKEDTRSLDGTLQEYLYNQSSSFTYTSPRPLAPQSRVFDHCQNALWYWGFESHHWWHGHGYSHTTGIPARTPRGPLAERPFEVALTDLICGVNGRRARWLDATSTETGWSKIVDDLIRHTARATFKRQNAYVSRNQEPLRGEDAVRAVNAAMGSNAPFLIRSSFGKILSIFDPELADLGKKIEWEGKAFEEDEFKKAHERRYPTKERGNDLPPPPLGNERPGSGDDDSGGCSFVIMDFSTD